KPEPSQEGAAAVTMSELEKNNIVVKLSRGGEVTVQNQPAKIDDLVSALREAKKSAANPEMVLDADDEAEHELVVQVLDAAAGAQIEKVLFVSRVNPP